MAKRDRVAGKRRHPVIATLDDERKKQGLKPADLHHVVGARPGAFFETATDPSIWTVERAANALGLRLALVRRRKGDDPLSSPVDTVGGPRLSQRIAEMKRKLDKEPTAYEAAELGWDFTGSAHPVVKSVFLHMTAFGKSLSQMSRLPATPAYQTLHKWGANESSPRLAELASLLEKAGLGLKVVPLAESDSVKYKDEAGTWDPEDDPRARIVR